MAPTHVAPGTVTTVPDYEALKLIMRECSCDETRAADLLRRNGNDPHKAVSHQRRMNGFLARHGHSHTPSGSLTPEPARNPSTSGRNTPTSHSVTSAGSWDTPPSDPSDSRGRPDGEMPRVPPSPTWHAPNSPSAMPENTIPSPTAPRPFIPRKPFKPVALQSEYPVSPTPSTPPSPTPLWRAYVPEHPPTGNSGREPSSGPEVPRPDILMTDPPPVVIEARQPHQPSGPAKPTPPGPDVDMATEPAAVEVPSIWLNGRQEVPDTASEEWDFLLPRLPVPDNFVTGQGEGEERGEFSIYDLVGAVQNGADFQIIQNHVRGVQSVSVRRQINYLVEGFPSIFYAVESNNPVLVRLWVSYGADVSAVHPQTGTPLLAYAIALSGILDGEDTSTLVATLLSLGASPKTIPDQFYSPYTHDLPEDGPTLENEDGEVDKAWSWCTPLVRRKLALAANLTQRYYLERATKLKRAGIRHRQIATRRNAEAILGIQYYLIGQTLASNKLLRKLLSYITLPSRRPLVLAFAGPSGHGKTELARRLGHLLGLELQVVDCTIVNQEKELFGPRAPYVGSERGSPLNNFIARNAGQRSIVFLDEFEKTSRDIHQSLLLPFDNGEYQDRRHLTTIDCSKTIWILATNALDDTILKFCGLNPEISTEEGKAQQLAKKLSKELRAAFLDRFGAPVTGRVSDFIPFLPFSSGEQAVVAHKFMVELAEKVRAPVNLSPGPEEQLLGNVRLRVRRDALVCAHLAESEYSEELGARSLRTAVEHLEDSLVERYLDEDKEIEEEEGLREFVVDVKAGEIIITKGS